MEKLSLILWRERELLELLLFKLEEEQLLLAAGRSRWLGHATREVEMVLEEIRRAELGRAVEVEAVAVELGLAPDVSLRELSEQAPAPWNDILREHRNAFMTASAEISALA
ncbi:flagellar export chaperone FlgN, partial [uncultured Nocardioides sp.]